MNIKKIISAALASVCLISSIPSTAGYNEKGIFHNLTETQAEEYEYCKNDTWGYFKYSNYIKLDSYYGSGVSDITIPSSIDGLPVRVLDTYLIFDPDVKRITVPDSVTAINLRAFAFCHNLESIRLPARITGEFAEYSNFVEAYPPTSMIDTFCFCYKLKEVKIPEGITYIGAYGGGPYPSGFFRDCEGIEKIELPSTLKTIGSGTIVNCPNLKSLTIPVSVTKIEELAFFDSDRETYAISDCSSLKDIYYAGTYKQWSQIEKTNCGLSSDAVVHCLGDNTSSSAINETVRDIQFYEGGSYHVIKNVKLSKQMFDQNNKQYHKDISTLAVSLSMAAYNEKGKYDGRMICQAYDNLGFKNQMLFSYSKCASIYKTGTEYFDDYDKRAFSIAAKEFDDTILICTTIRGTDLLHDLGTDLEFDAEEYQMGDGSYHYFHSGFAGFYEEIVMGMALYQKKYQSMFKSGKKIKYLITGHSLGAAAAQIFGYSLNKVGKGEGNIFVYTYASPNTYPKDKHPNNPVEGAENIFNIVESSDTIPKLPPSSFLTVYGKLGWEFEFHNTGTHNQSNYVSGVEKNSLKDITTSYKQGNKFIRNVYKYKIECPVDVDVYYKDTLIAQIKDETVNEEFDIIPVSVNENKEKIVYMPASDDYQIVITAYDEGTMKVSRIGTELTEFENIDLTEGKKFSIMSDALLDPELTVINNSFEKELMVENDGTEIPYVERKLKFGDANGDDIVDASDASVALMEYSSVATGSETILTKGQTKACDVNSDGVVDASDASLLLAFYAYRQTNGTETDMKIWIDNGRK